MFFKNISVYRLPVPFDISSQEIGAAVFVHKLQPCNPTDSKSVGWVSPKNNGETVSVINNQILLALGVEEKILPASVVKQFANEKANEIEEKEGRKVGRKEMRDLCEAITLDLLPRAFVRRRTTFGWIDPVNGWLVVDAASPAKAEEFLEQLRKSVDSFPAKTLQVTQPPSSAMTEWVANGEAPAGFTIDQDLNLASPEHAEVRYVKHTLEGGDVKEQIASGKVATKLALTWHDRISFVLTETLQIKRLRFLDILKEQNESQAENAEELFDLDFVLMAGEVAKLLLNLISALGGEWSKATETKEPKADKMEELNTRLAELSPDVAYEEAKKIVIENRRASISLVQRHLRIGYNFAARLIERMESDGLVTPMDEAGVRKVLVIS